METEKPNGNPVYTSDVLEELRKYESHEEVELCLECGYSGMMGIVREELPWFVSWWVLLPVFLILIGIFGTYGGISGIVIGVLSVIIRSAYSKKIVVCPKCKNTLVVS